MKIQVDMTIECRPDLIEHLMEEFCSTADFENATVTQYRYYVEKTYFCDEDNNELYTLTENGKEERNRS